MELERSGAVSSAPVEAVSPYAVTTELGEDAMLANVPSRAELAETMTRIEGGEEASLVSQLRGGAAPRGGRYEVGALLGTGGMGTVLVAKDRDLARRVALKKLKTAPPSPEQLERFLREAQVTAQLEHPGVVPVHDLGVDSEGHFYYTMRIVRGEQTLRNVIDRLRSGDERAHREFTFERRVRLIQQVAQVLRYAHRKGVVHRDVKPENVMLGPFGEVYLLDWGLAKITGIVDPAPSAPSHPAAPSPDEGISSDTTRGETQAGRIMGTPLYMAPEQALGKDVTPRTDVYSLSAVLYELLTAHHYLDDAEPASLAELLERISKGDHLAAEERFDALNGRTPRALSKACERGLAKDPAERFGSALELEQELERWLEGDSAVICPATLLIRILNRWRRAIDRRPVLVTTVTFLIPLMALLAWLTFKVWALAS